MNSSSSKGWRFRIAAAAVAVATLGAVGPALAQDSVRPEVGKPLQAAQELIKAQRFKEALAKVRDAEAAGAHNPNETYLIESMRIAAASGAGDTDTEPSGFANGHARDVQGRLIGCSHRHRHIQRTELDGTVTVLAARFEGRRLNSPNDIVCQSDGSIWFTDPIYGISTDYEGGKQAPELPPTLYRLDPAGTLHAMATDFTGPNGLAFSPDEQRLYVSESGGQFDARPTRYIRVFDVQDGGARLGPGRVFHTLAPGNPDGFRCDEHGNIWCSAADGVHCIAPDGRLLGKVRVPHTVANVAFGGRFRSRLFICGSHTLYAIYLNVRGAARP